MPSHIVMVVVVFCASVEGDELGWVEREVKPAHAFPQFRSVKIVHFHLNSECNNLYSKCYGKRELNGIKCY